MSEEEKDRSKKGIQNTALGKMMKQVGDNKKHLEDKVDRKNQNISKISDINTKQSSIMKNKVNEVTQLQNEVNEYQRDNELLVKKLRDLERALQEKEKQIIDYQGREEEFQLQ